MQRLSRVRILHMQYRYCLVTERNGATPIIVRQSTRGTSDLCLVMDGAAGSRILQGYAHADWGGDLDTRRSTTGYIFQVYGSTACWKSRLQQTVALSTMDAELQASSDTIWHALSADLDLTTESLTKNPNNFDESKHFDIRRNFDRERK